MKIRKIVNNNAALALLLSEAKQGQFLRTSFSGR